jgi:hemophore-related protein
LSLTAGAAVASADPDLGPMVNSTCSYPQVVSAINAGDPGFADAFNSAPENSAALRQFLAAPPSQRMQMAQQIANAPGAAQNYPFILQAFNTCHNY